MITIHKLKKQSSLGSTSFLKTYIKDVKYNIFQEANNILAKNFRKIKKFLITIVYTKQLLYLECFYKKPNLKPHKLII